MSYASYLPTQRLQDLKATQPEMAQTIEKMCFALMATRGVLITYQCEAVLSYVNRQIEPWVDLTSAKNEANKEKDQSCRLKRKSRC